MQTVSVQSDLFGNPKRTAGSAFKYPLCGSCAQPLNNCQEGHRLFTFVGSGWRIGLGGIGRHLYAPQCPKQAARYFRATCPLKALFHPRERKAAARGWGNWLDGTACAEESHGCGETIPREGMGGSIFLSRKA